MSNNISVRVFLILCLCVSYMVRTYIIMPRTIFDLSPLKCVVYGQIFCKKIPRKGCVLFRCNLNNGKYSKNV